MSKPMTSALLGALLGGGGSYLAHHLRKKDEDENKHRGLTQALVGALLGGAGGYAVGSGIPGGSSDPDPDTPPGSTDKKVVVTPEQQKKLDETGMSRETQELLNKFLGGVAPSKHVQVDGKYLVQPDGGFVGDPQFADLRDVPGIMAQNPTTMLALALRGKRHATSFKDVSNVKRTLTHHPDSPKSKHRGQPYKDGTPGINHRLEKAHKTVHPRTKRPAPRANTRPKFTGIRRPLNPVRHAANQLSIRRAASNVTPGKASNLATMAALALANRSDQMLVQPAYELYQDYETNKTQ